MNLKEYQLKCKQSAKKNVDKDKEIMTWGLGVAGEAGDLVGCIKKTVNHDNDQTSGIKENIGDVMWYLAMICNFYGWDFESLLYENIEKLSKRYSKGKFTSEHAKRNNTRIDWNE